MKSPLANCMRMVRGRKVSRSVLIPVRPLRAHPDPCIMRFSRSEMLVFQRASAAKQTGREIQRQIEE